MPPVMTEEGAPTRGRFGASRRERSGAMGLAILLHVLAFLALLLHKSLPVPVKMEQGLKAFMLMPEAKKDGDKQAARTKSDSAKSAKTEKREQPLPPEPVPPPPIPKPAVDEPLPYILMSHRDFASSDISKMRSARLASADDGTDSKAPYGPGSGPGGATLYPADWFREPSSTELGGYLREGQPRTGWGLIACRTIAHYKVEDCYIVGESPRGSGFGRSVLNASWQFLVQPPRINGKPQVGSWVSIRITYVDGMADAG